MATTGTKARKLILHFDVNETIMIGDPAGGDTFEDCLNKMIAKNAFIRPREPPPAADEVGEGKPLGRWGEWTWHEDAGPNARGSSRQRGPARNGRLDPTADPTIVRVWSSLQCSGNQ